MWQICYNTVMDKEILEHQKYIEKELKRISKTEDGVSDLGQDQREDSLLLLDSYNTTMIHNFQHERLIHLMVTFFFAVVAIGSWIALLMWLFTVNGEWDIVTILLAVLALMLTILEACYVRFYYHLENWTQRLYALSTKIHKALQSVIK